MIPTLAHSSTSLVTRHLPGIGDARQEYLFLLSHMRSYSSLLAHLLGSSTDIDGCGETHIKYKRAIDLWRLRREVQRTIGTPPTSRYLLDKILHNNIRAPDRLMAHERMRAIIFLRRPKDTLRSIVTLARTQSPHDDIASPQFACDYYVSRLHRLRADGQRLGKRSLYFDAENMVEDDGQLLTGISEWLQLRQPLQPSYRISKRTGENRFGDPLANIRAGCILSASHSTIDQSVMLPAAVLDEATAAYSRCREALQDCCASL